MEQFDQLVNRQREFFRNGKTLDYAFRKSRLNKIKHMLKRYESEIYHALQNDLNKSAQETKESISIKWILSFVRHYPIIIKRTELFLLSAITIISAKSSPSFFPLPTHQSAYPDSEFPA